MIYETHAQVLDHPWSSDGGPAYPAYSAGCDFRGMSLRAWLTGQALAGLLANPEAWASQMVGQLAVEAADLALAELADRGGRDE